LGRLWPYKQLYDHAGKACQENSTSLFGLSVSDREKSFTTLIPGPKVIKLPCGDLVIA
jgi:hypothetical protein